MPVKKWQDGYSVIKASETEEKLNKQETIGEKPTLKIKIKINDCPGVTQKNAHKDISEAPTSTGRVNKSAKKKMNCNAIIQDSITIPSSDHGNPGPSKLELKEQTFKTIEHKTPYNPDKEKQEIGKFTKKIIVESGKIVKTSKIAIHKKDYIKQFLKFKSSNIIKSVHRDAVNKPESKVTQESIPESGNSAKISHKSGKIKHDYTKSLDLALENAICSFEPSGNTIKTKKFTTKLKECTQTSGAQRNIYGAVKDHLFAKNKMDDPSDPTLKCHVTEENVTESSHTDKKGIKCRDKLEDIKKISQGYTTYDSNGNTVKFKKGAALTTPTIAQDIAREFKGEPDKQIHKSEENIQEYTKLPTNIGHDSKVTEFIDNSSKSANKTENLTKSEETDLKPENFSILGYIPPLAEKVRIPKQPKNVIKLKKHKPVFLSSVQVQKPPIDMAKQCYYATKTRDLNIPLESFGDFGLISNLVTRNDEILCTDPTSPDILPEEFVNFERLTETDYIDEKANLNIPSGNLIDYIVSPNVPPAGNTDTDVKIGNTVELTNKISLINPKVKPIKIGIKRRIIEMPVKVTDASKRSAATTELPKITGSFTFSTVTTDSVTESTDFSSFFASTPATATVTSKTSTITTELPDPSNLASDIPSSTEFSLSTGIPEIGKELSMSSDMATLTPKLTELEIARAKVSTETTEMATMTSELSTITTDLTTEASTTVLGTTTDFSTVLPDVTTDADLPTEVDIDKVDENALPILVF